MIALAFLMTVIFVPGYVGASMQPGWALLSITLPFLLWRGKIELPVPLQSLGVAFLGYALLSICWSPNHAFGINAVWQLCLIAGAFVLGTRMEAPDRIVKALAIGLSVSSALSIAQALGYHPVLSITKPAGLLYSSIVLGEATALVVIWLAIRRLWTYILPLIPALYLSDSRGAWVAIGIVGFVWLARRSWLGYLGLLLVAAIAIRATMFTNFNDSIRVALWYLVYDHLTWFGSGAGAMDSVVLIIGGSPAFPDYAHNEFLDYWFQYGVGILLVAPIFLYTLDKLDEDLWYPFLGFAVMAFYSFPLHVPITVFIGAMCAGRLCRGGAVVWCVLDHRRYGVIRWASQSRRRYGLLLR